MPPDEVQRATSQHYRRKCITLGSVTCLTWILASRHSHGGGGHPRDSSHHSSSSNHSSSSSKHRNGTSFYWSSKLLMSRDLPMTAYKPQPRPRSNQHHHRNSITTPPRPPDQTSMYFAQTNKDATQKLIAIKNVCNNTYYDAITISVWDPL